MKPRSSYCIFGGRFQPFHFGHLAVIEYLANAWSGPIVLGIVKPHPIENFPGDDDNWPRFSASDNPLSYWDRVSAIHSTLEKTPFKDRISLIVPMPRPSVNLLQSNNYLPPRPRVIALRDELSDEIEQYKARKYEEQGERVFHVPTAKFPDRAKIASGSLVRAFASIGDASWKLLVPEPVAESIEKSDAFEKISTTYTHREALKIIQSAALGASTRQPFIALGLRVPAGQHDDQEELRHFTTSRDRLQTELGLSSEGNNIHMYINNNGQVGAMGPNANAKDNTFTNCITALEQIQKDQLLEGLSKVRAEIREQSANPDKDIIAGDIARAEQAIESGDNEKAASHLKEHRSLILSAAEKIGVPVVVEVIKGLFT